jgi:pimeloyl-ACP methyl ester carboxylesterase
MLPHAVFVPIDSAGHLPYIEQPDATVGAMVRFLRGVQ